MTTKNIFDSKKVNKNEVKFYSISLVLSFTGVIMVIVSQIYYGWTTIDDLRTEKLDLDYNSVFIQIAVAVLFLLIIIFSKKENSRKIFTLTFVFCLLLSVGFLLFNQAFYKSFLRTIQYGGDIPINIEYRKADNTEAIVEGDLLIRTNTSLTIKKISTVEEIPSNRISKIIFVKYK